MDSVPPIRHLQRDSIHAPLRKSGGDTRLFGVQPANQPPQQSNRNVALPVPLQEDDTWLYSDWIHPSHGCENNETCVYRGGVSNDDLLQAKQSTRTHASAAAPTGCALISDQFAYIPSELAAVYFTGRMDPNFKADGKDAQGLRHYGKARGGIPKSHWQCEWPEGLLTCAIMDHGVGIQALKLRARLAKYAGLGYSQCGSGRPIVDNSRQPWE